MKNRRALLLSCFMLRGYGVSVVADQLQKRLRDVGWDLHIGYLETDEFSTGTNRIYMPADSKEISAYCERNGIDVVIAQTSPYFEVLPELGHQFPVVCYEHGDPTPEFFLTESDRRAAVKRHKADSVYPHVTQVWTISDFLRHDIGWPSARVVANGADHLGVAPAKKQREPSEEVRVGFLARLGALESEYKGNELLIELASRFSADDGIDFRVMGRGSEADARNFRAAGMSVALNASDAEREAFFADIDVFFSPSQWEGFNLPLVEAQYAGCASMAFDVGAHPETTPYVMRDMNDIEVLLRHWVDDRTALFAAGQRCQRFVSSKFSWDSTALKIAALLDELAPVSYRGPLFWRRFRNVLRAEGIGGTLKKVMRKVVSTRK